MNDDGLTAKQRIFVNEYLATWNASEAARKANYKWPEKAGSANLRKKLIVEAIGARMKESAMSADEVLARLSEQARTNIADFLIERTVTFTDKNGNMHDVQTIDINWEELKARGHLVKELSWTKDGRPVLKLYDAQNALIYLGKKWALFSENLDITSAGQQIKAYISISPDDWDEQK